MNDFSLWQTIIIWAIPVIFAITVHEVAHGWVANKLGDPTALLLGRITLNPIKHIDPIGTLIVPGILIFLGGFIFGWAKPVPIDWRNLRKPRRDSALVAAAGPASNLLMALFWALIIKIGLVLGNNNYFNTAAFYAMGQAGISINLVLMALNLIPIPPLDGSRVVSSFLPTRAAITYNRIEPFGFFILLALLATGLLGYLLMPIVATFKTILQSLFNIM